MARAMHEAGVRPLTGATVNAETRTAPGRRVLTRSRPCARHWRFPEPCVGRHVSVCESRGQRQRRKGLVLSHTIPPCQPEGHGSAT